MERPVVSSKFSKIAKRLATLPPELIDPIVMNMQLYSVLEVSLAADASSTLLCVIRENRNWAWVWGRKNEFKELQEVYETLQQLSYLWFNKAIIHTVPELEHWDLSSAVGTQRGSYYHQYTNFECLRYHSRPYEYSHRVPVLARLKTECVSLFSRLLERLAMSHIDRVSLKTSLSTPGLTNTQLEALAAFMPENIVRIVDGSVEDLHSERSWSMCLMNISSDDHLRQKAVSIRDMNWNITSMRRFLPYILRALELLAEARSEELKRLAKLYEQYPSLLKEPFAPQTARKNPRHVLDSLLFDSNRTLRRIIHGRNKFGRIQISSYRFRYPHPALVPYNWCFELFQLASTKETQCNLIFSEELRPHVHHCKHGFSRIYGHAGLSEYTRVQGLSHIDYRGHVNRFLPHSARELDWLESFMRCVTWIRSNLDIIGIDPESIVSVGYPDRSQSSRPKVLLDADEYNQFLRTAPLDMIARQLHIDSRIGDDPRATQLPSLLALYLPSWPSPQAQEIARTISPGVSDDIAQIVYEDMVRKARHEISKPRMATTNSVPNYALTADAKNLQGRANTQENDRKSSSWRDTLRKYMNANPRLRGPSRRSCYICQRNLKTPHAVFSSMCAPCGEFNLAGSSLSLPGNLNLIGKTALVTGARINLGFHTVLRLLRCGARVIASTRYPEDAYARYAREQDSLEWLGGGRLRIVGADFRIAADAFNLVKETKGILAEWGDGLDILINNAAQTLTDGVDKEREAITNEKRLAIVNGAKNTTILRGPYEPRVRGIAANKGFDKDLETGAHGINSETSVELSQFTDTNAYSTTKVAKIEASDANGSSSWVQSLSEIPYEDIISAQSVNTLVPLILIRELTSLMGQIKSKSQRPLGHIINVSSREGIFEASNKSPAKNGKHVHTNISKAGLNMITETEAQSIWTKRRVAMNTVDPGYMSAAPEIEKTLGAERPIGWEDGAGRVLWPVAISGDESIAPIWGMFLKHYGACRVDVRWRPE